MTMIDHYGHVDSATYALSHKSDAVSHATETHVSGRRRHLRDNAFSSLP